MCDKMKKAKKLSNITKANAKPYVKKKQRWLRMSEKISMDLDNLKSKKIKLKNCDVNDKSNSVVN